MFRLGGPSNLILTTSSTFHFLWMLSTMS
uniref:Uncharacterized protein n=1 Tax=Arundo donax TaxID=35708 RepID=A0A0A9GSF8_ARUDO